MSSPFCCSSHEQQLLWCRKVWRFRGVAGGGGGAHLRGLWVVVPCRNAQGRGAVPPGGKTRRSQEEERKPGGITRARALLHSTIEPSDTQQDQSAPCCCCPGVPRPRRARPWRRALSIRISFTALAFRWTWAFAHEKFPGPWFGP